MVFRSIEKSNKHKILKAKNWVAFKIEEEIKHNKINIGNTIMPCCEERLVTKPCRLGMQKNVNSYVYVWYKTNFRLRFPSLIITAHINQSGRSLTVSLSLTVTIWMTGIFKWCSEVLKRVTNTKF